MLFDVALAMLIMHGFRRATMPHVPPNRRPHRPAYPQRPGCALARQLLLHGVKLETACLVLATPRHRQSDRITTVHPKTLRRNGISRAVHAGEQQPAYIVVMDQWKKKGQVSAQHLPQGEEAFDRAGL